MDGDDTLPLDELYVKEILSKPPFVELEGVINTRDLGYLPSSEPGKVTKPGYIFRAAELSAITPAGKDKLRALGVITVFDLRSDTEIAKYDSPLPQIDGVQVLHTPVFKSEDYSPEMMAR